MKLVKYIVMFAVVAMAACEQEQPVSQESFWSKYDRIKAIDAKDRTEAQINFLVESADVLETIQLQEGKGRIVRKFYKDGKLSFRLISIVDENEVSKYEKIIDSQLSTLRVGAPGGVNAAFFNTCQYGYTCGGWNQRASPFGHPFPVKYVAYVDRCDDGWQQPMHDWGTNLTLTYYKNDPGDPTPGNINSWSCV